MSLSSDKLIVAILLLITLKSYGQLEEYAWPEGKTPTVDLGQSVPEHDAVILYEIHTIDYNLMPPHPVTHTVHQLIKIFTQYGLNQSAYVYLPRADLKEILVLDARTIKQDGQIIDLASNEIYNSLLQSDPGNSEADVNFNFIRFAVPGVEVGDEIEIIYTLDEPGFYGGDIIPNSYAFSLLTRYEFIYPNRFELSCDLNNDFPQPQVENLFSKVKAIFTIQNSENILNESYSIPYLSLPWFSFRIRPTGISGPLSGRKQWDEADKSVRLSFKNPAVPKNKYVRYYQNLIRKTASQDSSSRFDQFRMLYNYLIDSVDMRKLSKKSETGKCNEFYLYKGYMDKLAFYRLAVQFLEEMDLDYDVCFCRNRYRGKIQVLNPRINEIDEFIFRIHDRNGSFHYLNLNHPISYFEVDELPPSLAGTLAVGHMKKYGQSILDTFRLPVWDEQENVVLNELNLDFNTENPDTCRLLVNSMFSGYFSQYIRGFNQLLHADTLLKNSFVEFKSNEEPYLHVDSSTLAGYQREYPFKLEVRTEAWMDHPSDIINDSLLSIPLEKLIDYHLLDLDPGERMLDYFPEFTYTDSVIVEVSFPENYTVRLLNGADLSFENSNPAGTYRMEIEAGKNEIKVFSSYQVRRNKIPVEEIGEIRSLNQSADRGKHNSLLVLLKRME